MLDALKFAFEIFVVGALAVPWIEVLYRMFPPAASPNLRFDLTLVPKEARSAVAIVVVVAVGYFLGSAISRFSRDFFDDEIWNPLPTEDRIRDSVYYNEFCAQSPIAFGLWSKPIHLEPVTSFCPKLQDISTAARRTFNGLNPSDARLFNNRVQEVFRLEDSAIQLQGLDRVDRLKQYFDQITVLRGAALNAFILFSLAIFGACGRLKDRWPGNKWVALLGALPSGILALYALYSFKKHWFDTDNNPYFDLYGDPPLAETILLLLALVGLYMAWKPERNLPYLRICIIAIVAMVISFGGWWWTEATYDLQVVHTLVEIRENNKILSIENKSTTSIPSPANPPSSPPPDPAP